MELFSGPGLLLLSLYYFSSCLQHGALRATARHMFLMAGIGCLSMTALSAASRCPFQLYPDLVFSTQDLWVNAKMLLSSLIPRGHFWAGPSRGQVCSCWQGTCVCSGLQRSRGHRVKCVSAGFVHSPTACCKFGSPLSWNEEWTAEVKTLLHATEVSTLLFGCPVSLGPPMPQSRAIRLNPLCPHFLDIRMVVGVKLIVLHLVFQCWGVPACPHTRFLTL